MSNKHGGIAMDPVIGAAARALASGDALGALKRVALRDDPHARALRGIAMAQLGDLPRARDLLRDAAGGFGPGSPLTVARCNLAMAEISLVLRDLGGLTELLQDTGSILETHGDRSNLAHATYLQARLALLLGRLDQAEDLLSSIDPAMVPGVSRPGYWLVAVGIAMRRVEAGAARIALSRAAHAARLASVPSVLAEVETARQALRAPAARLIIEGTERSLGLAEVEKVLASDRLVVDACRNLLRQGPHIMDLSGRPILFGLVRALAEAWPNDVPREHLLQRVFRARQADDSHRARLRVEIARLRKMVAPLAGVAATRRGYTLKPQKSIPAVLAPPVEGRHADILALLADGESWSSSGLALALDVSPRTVQRMLDALSRSGKVEWFGHGRSRRWTFAGVPGFPTGLLLPVSTLRE
ncbi:MAG TPA: HTH domain-containing protein [Paracoccus sp. (in: a-proteobacteria)]|uniref:HTH domain-containing protein n=1 Tax=Paracoccus sp. TaxID=267 RepID=UPI002D0F04F4|nr:HTH domain-containing protein [Paracoccus sp. (in: a-proteobacteria)]HWL55832.1 HTH domain-containing protein [Paracoccus sp. (in: a-proteobacteria)]